MKELFQKVKTDMILSSVLSILIGVLLIFRAETAIDLVCMCIAFALVLFGAIYVVIFLASHFAKTFSLVTGLLMLIFGIWFFVQPEILASFIPCVIGVIILMHGFGSLRIALDAKAAQAGKSAGMMAASIITIALGILIIVFAFTVAKVVVQLLGVALIFDAVSNFWVVAKAAKTMKAQKQEDEAIDTEGKIL